MENTEKVNTNERPDERAKTGIGGAGCSFWIFGNEKSADNDLKGKFEVVDDEKKN